jgi:ADP-ribose pyrophosphatase YjhB (NUDIX family)
VLLDFCYNLAMTKKMTQEEFEASIAWSRVVAACVIKNDEGKYVLVQEAQPKVYGLWNLPAGHVDKGESIESAAIREAKEESGLDVELLEKIGIWQDKVEEPICHAFKVRITGGEIKPQLGEVLDVKWFSFDEVVKMRSEGKLRVEWIFDAISRVQRSRRAG